MRAIFCLYPGNVLGIDGKLPGKILGELKHFKDTTLGCPIIMGGETWRSIGEKPLNGRLNIILTSREITNPEVVRIKTIEEIEACPDSSWIIGGAHLLRQTEHLIDRYLISYPKEECIKYPPRVNGQVYSLYNPNLFERGFWPVNCAYYGDFNVIEWKRLSSV